MRRNQDSRQGNPPVIVIGMHRSGTSLLCRLLEQLGLFVGRDTEHNSESLFFQAINRWLLHQAGGRWDNPDPIDALLDSRELSDLAAEDMQQRLHSPEARMYLGMGGYLRHRGIDSSLPFAWGWKDPRNTYTLPLWLRLFPDARVIYIERHGVDVAASLRARTRRKTDPLIARYRRLKPLHRFRPKRGGFCPSPRCLSLEGSLGLWESYIARSRAHMRALEANQGLSLGYEELLRAPVATLERAAAFAGLTPMRERIAALTADIRSDRAYAHRSDPELRGFADRHRARLAAWGVEASASGD